VRDGGPGERIISERQKKVALLMIRHEHFTVSRAARSTAVPHVAFFHDVASVLKRVRRGV